MRNLIDEFAKAEAINFDGQYTLLEGICERFEKWLNNEGYYIIHLAVSPEVKAEVKDVKG